MRFYALLLFFFATTPVFASEAVRWRSLPDGTLTFWVMHTESGVYELDRFEKKPGLYQDLREHQSFADSTKAKSRFEELTLGFTPGRPPLLLLQTGKKSRVLDGEIWPVTQAWDWAWEQKFAAWVADETDASFFRNYGISTDCADAAYAFRWIFARMNGLPAANHLSVSEDLFTSETLLPQWAALPTAVNWHEDARFRAALEYLLRNTYTHSLMEDLYPVKISREATLPGTIFIHLYNSETGHTEWLHSIKSSNHPSPLRVLASNVPREVRELAEYGMLDWGAPPTENLSGLLRFRWAVKSNGAWSVAAAHEMPFYSLEQYDPKFVQGFDSFVAAVTKKIIPDWKPDSAAVMREKVKLLKERLTARVKIVEDGFDFCLNQRGCPEGSASWETWSTPSRDAAVGRLVGEIESLYDDGMCSPGCKAALDDAGKATLTNIRGAPYTIGHALDVWTEKKYKSDPNLPIPERWGL